MPVNILCVGDLVGSPGRRILADHLPELTRQHEIELVVCNAENVAGGSGITPRIFSKLLHYGVDVVTLGDHVYRKREIASTLEQSEHIVRPANISARAAGRRWTVVPTKSGRHRVAVACLLGQMFMNPADSPWAAVDQILGEIPESVNMRIIDFHAEASSEKIAMGWFCNGRVSAVFGTHTHIPTADARVLDAGTAYISDVGMTGPYDGILGRRKDRVLWAMTTSMPTPFEVSTGDPRLMGVLIRLDEATGRATSIERIEICGYAQPEAAGKGRKDESGDQDQLD